MKEINDLFILLADIDWFYASEYILRVLNPDYVLRVVFSVSAEPYVQLFTRILKLFLLL